jgi:nucleoside phosphorylase
VPTTPGRFGHARIAVLSVIEEETEAVHRVFGLTKRVGAEPYFVARSSSITRPDVVTCQIGKANIQAGESIRDVIEHWQAEALILCGIAGGISEHADIEPGDVVVPKYIHYCSFARLSAGMEQVQYMAYDHPSISLHRRYAEPLQNDHSWRRTVRNILPGNRRPKVFVGSLVAGDKVLGDPDSEEQTRIIAEFEDAIAVDMESVGLCRAVASSRWSPQYNPRLLVIRGISDLVNTLNNRQQRAKYRASSATVAAIFARRVVADILHNEPDPR